MAKQGYISLHRQILENEIWLSKPAWWFKVWSYILLSVSHKGYGNLKRGQGYFTSDKIYSECNLSVENILPETVHNFIKFARKTRLITTDKTTRGMLISVLKYDDYQSSETTQKTTQETTLYNNNAFNNNENTICSKNETTCISPLNTRLLTTHYNESYLQKFKTNYVFNFAKDMSLARKLKEQGIEEQEMIDLINKFFNSNDKFITQSDYSFGVFYSQVNKLRQQKEENQTVWNSL